ncbi:MAG: hypothetical protein WBC70_07490 [Candidatus Aminicenantales bacterium]
MKKSILSATAIMALITVPALMPMETPAPVRISPPFTVRVVLEADSPFVPDGRASIAELSLKVVFPFVTFEFDLDEDPLLGRCQVTASNGRGTISRLILNDVQRGDERVAASFLTPRPPDFPAGLGIESEPMEEDESAARSGTAPAKIRLAFWTGFSRAPIRWGSKFGTASLSDFKIVFEVPFRDLLAGKAHSLTLPYQGHHPEDSGTWRIDFRPAPKKK